MRFTLDQTDSPLSIRRYGSDGVVIGNQRLTRPFLLTRERLVGDWQARSLESLQPADLEPVFALDVDVLIIGSRATERIAPLEIRRVCRARGLALESMELGAACRTFNVLLTEGRLVAAAMFP